VRQVDAFVLLGSAESVKALAECLGHSDPGLTPKAYAHLMASSREPARKALGQALRPQDHTG
jgi:integrase